VAARHIPGYGLMETGMARGIDIHTHMVPRDFPAYSGRAAMAPWPAMDHDGCGHANILISGKLFRTVGEAAWSVPRRLGDLADMGVARQVISPMPELLSYWLDPADARVLLRHVNGAIAEMVAEDPDRLIGMGAVPLQDLDLAIGELRYNLESLSLRGVEVGSNVNGVPIGDPRFEPFFAAAADLGVPVFVHALRAAGTERLIGPPLLEQIIAFPGEIALAAASLITSGILARLPNLRIAFSHGGGGLAMTLARMEHFWSELPKFGDVLAESPRQSARRAYFDLAVFDPSVVRFLADSFGVSQLLIGSDYPFGAYEKAPHDLLRAADFGDADIVKITETNAKRYLGLNHEGMAT
jgi:aminocarboxymuconate-semialdehyde decarboxylase